MNKAYSEDYLYPISSWTEEDGDVLWWRFPIVEPPYCGSPLDLGKTVGIQVLGANADFTTFTVQVGGWIEDYYTHWTKIRMPQDPTKAA